MVQPFCIVADLLDADVERVGVVAHCALFLLAHCALLIEVGFGVVTHCVLLNLALGALLVGVEVGV